MKKINILSVGFILINIILLVSCSKVAPEKVCSTDKDCLPATCCHPKAAVNVQSAPDCSEIMCTMECASNTLDCGQGEIKCISGECKVKLIV